MSSPASQSIILLSGGTSSLISVDSTTVRLIHTDRKQSRFCVTHCISLRSQDMTVTVRMEHCPASLSSLSSSGSIQVSHLIIIKHQREKRARAAGVKGARAGFCYLHSVLQTTGYLGFFWDIFVLLPLRSEAGAAVVSFTPRLLYFLARVAMSSSKNLIYGFCFLKSLILAFICMRQSLQEPFIK